MKTSLLKNVKNKFESDIINLLLARIAGMVCSFILLIYLSKFSGINISDIVYRDIAKIQSITVLVLFGFDKIVWRAENIYNLYQINLLWVLWILTWLIIFAPIIHNFIYLEDLYLIYTSILYAIILYISWIYQSLEKKIISTLLFSAILPFIFLVTVIFDEYINYEFNLILLPSIIVAILIIVNSKVILTQVAKYKLSIKFSYLSGNLDVTLYTVFPAFFYSYSLAYLLEESLNSCLGCTSQYSGMLRLLSVYNIISFVYNRNSINRMKSNHFKYSYGISIMIFFAVIIYVFFYFSKGLIFDNLLQIMYYDSNMIIFILANFFMNYFLTQLTFVSIVKKELRIIALGTILSSLFIYLAVRYYELFFNIIPQLVLIATMIKLFIIFSSYIYKYYEKV